MALYHKHRPQDFSTVIGQEHIIKTITNEILHNKVAHAYLFSGPRGVGKTTLARLLAKAMNCEKMAKDSFSPCNNCSSCQEISSSRSMDVLEIDAASHTGVDNVRENIIDNAQFKSAKSKYKIFIIDEVHMLSSSAFNALLKTLEEPPEHVIFILATTELHKLPDTIISRCQRFLFHKVKFDILTKHLQTIAKEEDTKIDKEVIERLVGKSDGCVRDAVSLLDQLLSSGEKTITSETASLVLPNTNNESSIKFLQALINKNLKTGIELIASLGVEGVDFYQFALDSVELLRLLMIYQATNNISELDVDLDDKSKKDLIKLSENISGLDLVRLIDLLLTRADQVKTTSLPQLPLEMTMIEWCQTTDSKGTDSTDYNSGASNSSGNEKINIPTTNITINEVVVIEPEKKTIVEKVKDLIHHTAHFTKDEVEKIWPEFLKKIEVRSTALTFILKMASVANVDDNKVTLSVAYSFHSDKLNEKKSRDTMEEIMGELLSGKVRLEASVLSSSEQKAGDDELQQLASAVGGEVV